MVRTRLVITTESSSTNNYERIEVEELDDTAIESDCKSVEVQSQLNGKVSVIVEEDDNISLIVEEDDNNNCEEQSDYFLHRPRLLSPQRERMITRGSSSSAGARCISPPSPRNNKVSPSSCYSYATKAEMEPISPISATRRSLGMDEATYNYILTAMPSSSSSATPTTTTTTRSPTAQFGSSSSSCPYCKVGSSVEHHCPRVVLIENPAHDGKEGEEKTSANPATATLGWVLSDVSAGGVLYRPEQVLAEGWLQKKGTGKDWLGSRSWKARWARLCMASIAEYDEFHVPQDNHKGPPVPLLLLYWFPASTQVSTVIELESTIAMSVDIKGHAFPHRFEVRHAATRANGAHPPVPRVFAAPQKSRDAWLYAISQTLLQHAKAKSRSRKLMALQPPSSPQQRRPERPTPISELDVSSVAQQQQTALRGCALLEEEYPWNRGLALGDSITSPQPEFSSPRPPVPTRHRSRLMDPRRPLSPTLLEDHTRPRPTIQRSPSLPM